MRTRRITFIGLCCIVLVVLLSPILYANTTHVFSFHNNNSTEPLKIRLEQYQIDREGKRVAAQSKSVLPGEKVSYIPVIRNIKEDCYVRLHIVIEMDDSEIKRKISMEDIYGLGSDWKEIGDYLYFTRVLGSGTSVDVFQGIQIPYVWTQRRHESCGFTVYAFADAINSMNITPNFNSDSPWDGATESYRTGSSNSMPGGRDIVRTGDDNMHILWLAVMLCMLAIAVCSFWNMRR